MLLLFLWRIDCLEFKDIHMESVVGIRWVVRGLELPVGS
jgi:hypothetical protein